MTVDKSVFSGKAKPPPCPTTSLCHSEASFASTANSTISTVERFRDIRLKYHIDPRVLGTGHHGAVRKCLDRATGEQYAVKSIRKVKPAVTPSGRLARETGLLREMKHPNIVRLVDVYEDAEHVHIVTDLCRGGELFDRIVERTSRGGDFGDGRAPCLAEDEAAGILRQILSAVSHLHARGVAHRDVKPENVLFETADSNSPIKLVDFGLARRHFRGDPPMTNFVGTPYYVAPEVLGRRYGKSCDLWSVGVCAYAMLCGYPPFNGANNKEVHDSVRRGQYRFPHQEWSRVSEEAVDFIRRLLQMDPRKRMTANEALNHPWMTRHVTMHGDAGSTTMEEAGIRSGASWQARNAHRLPPRRPQPRTAMTLAPNLPSAESHIRSYVVARNEVHEENSSVEVVLNESSNRGSRLIRRIIKKLK